MNIINDIDRKRLLAPHLYYIMATAGLPVKDVRYNILTDSNSIHNAGYEYYTVVMKNGSTYNINVSADSPITAVYEVVNKMRFK